MKKVLIVTYYWPPAGGPGVQRWLKFVKYLSEFDIEPVVYIPENPSYPILDESLIAEVPSEVKILKQPIFEPYAIAEVFSKKDSKTISSGIIKDEERQSFSQKAMLYIRGNYFIPDARKFWVKPSVKFLKNEIDEGNYDILITTGPPHSLHLIGLHLKKSLNIKWLADFRDPWTAIGYHSKLRLNSSSRKKHEALEKDVLNTADHILTTSYTTKKEFNRKTSRPITVITNGYDDSEVSKKIVQSDKFVVAHIGSLLSGRDPVNLWNAISEIIDEEPEFKTKLELKLAGRVSEEVTNSIKNAGLEPYLLNLGYVSHSEALELQRSANILLLLEIDSEETKGIIPGKLFEYMAAKRPILAVGPKRWDAGKIVLETNSGAYFHFKSKLEVKEWIKPRFKSFLKGEPSNINNEIDQYHRKELTAKLAKVIREM